MRTSPRLALLLCLALALGAAPSRAQDKVLNIYNWTDYIDPRVLDDFTRATGITVRYDVFDSLETLEAKLLAGESGYDIVVPSNEPTFSKLVRSGALAVLDRAKIPNWKNLDPALMRQAESSDPDNRHGVIYLWGSTGLGIAPERIRALAPGAPLDSWALLLDPAWAKKLAPCGIIMMDSAIDVIPGVLHYLGHDQNSTAPADLADVARTLMAIRPYIRTFASGGALEALATGGACLALDYSGDVAQAAARARGARNGVSLAYVVPREGAEISFDMLAVPSDAPHKEAALAFINFVLQPSVMARITDATLYPNAVPATRALISPSLLNDPAIFPTEAIRRRFFAIGPVPPAATRARNRLWERFKAGG